MTSLFPFGFPLPTAFYLTLFVMTLVIHVVFMNYVLAGSAYLAFVSLFPGPKGRHREGPIALMLCDWMPFAISAAITAAIAPLLFLQILYKTRFYTANLLLFNRWMAIVPVLIVGFYMAYLFKSKHISSRPAWVRAGVGLGMLLCFAFTAYSWTENHLLSMESVPTLAAFYGSHAIVYRNPQILPRLGIWVSGAFATMAILVAWQLLAKAREAAGGKPADAVVAPQVVRVLAWQSLVALLAAGLCGLIYLNMRDTASPEGVIAPWSAVTSPLAAPYAVVAALGAVAQVLGWLWVLRSGRLCRGRLALLSIACLVTIVSATVVREAIRIRSVDFPALFAEHRHSAGVGGLTVFLVFFAVNAVLIGACFMLVKRGRLPSAPSQH